MLSQTYGAGHHVARGFGEARMLQDARISKGFSLYGNRQTTCILADRESKAQWEPAPIASSSLYRIDHPGRFGPTHPGRMNQLSRLHQQELIRLAIEVHKGIATSLRRPAAAGASLFSDCI
jgi:hypothetical protein